MAPEQRLGVDLTAYRQMAHDGERRNQVEQAADREYPAQLVTRLVREQAHDHAHGSQAQHDVGYEADQPARLRGPECEPDRGQLNGQHDRSRPRLGHRDRYHVSRYDEQEHEPVAVCRDKGTPEATPPPGLGARRGVVVNVVRQLTSKPS